MIAQNMEIYAKMGKPLLKASAPTPLSLRMGGKMFPNPKAAERSIGKISSEAILVELAAGLGKGEESLLGQLLLEAYRGMEIPAGTRLAIARSESVVLAECVSRLYVCYLFNGNAGAVDVSAELDETSSVGANSWVLGESTLLRTEVRGETVMTRKNRVEGCEIHSSVLAGVELYNSIIRGSTVFDSMLLDTALEGRMVVCEKLESTLQLEDAGMGN